MARWTYKLCSSHDLAKIGDLKRASGKSLTLTLNKAGSATFTYPMDAEYAEDINPYVNGIKVYRNNVLIWSGYILTVDENVTANSMTVSCVGWLQRLEKRFLRQKKIYTYVPGVNPPATATAVDDGDIIFGLLAEANLAVGPDGYVIPVVPGSVPFTSTWLQQGQKLPNEGPGGATPYTPAMRGRTYEIYQGILSGIDEMTNLENGCDIEVDPLTRALNIYRKKQRVLEDVVFGYNWGPKNIAQLGRQIDGSTAINYMVASGRSGVVPRYDDEPAYQQQYGLLEEMASLSDVSDERVLQVYSAGEVFMRRNPRVVYSMTPFTYSEENGVPEPFVDYTIGDYVYFSAVHKPRVNIIKEGVRVFGMTVSEDAEGNEVLGQLQLSPA